VLDTAQSYTVAAADGNTTWAEVRGPTAVAGTWTHLAAVYDAGTGQARLYVNGQQYASAAVPGTFGAGGTFTIGRGRWNGADTGYWHGDVDAVVAYQGVLSDQAIHTLANS
jgi:Concanavalin A-like lectin/glucanases superfamily